MTTSAITSKSFPLPSMGVDALASTVSKGFSKNLDFCCKDFLKKIETIWLSICTAVQEFFTKIGEFLFGTSHTTPIVMHTTPTAESMKKAYWGLGTEKWREGIDGCHHNYGREVYDRGLHGGTVEQGYVGSLEKAFTFVGENLGQPTTANLYLRVHKVVCGHFNGAANNVLMGQDKVGVFRDAADGGIGWNNMTGTYAMHPEAKREFTRLGLGTVHSTSLTYRSMSRAEVERIFNNFANDYHTEIAQAKTPREKLTAIAKFTQRCEWLHPPRDGCGRTDSLILNKHLVENGFHPVILEYPYKSSTLALNDWVDYLEKGLRAWEDAQRRFTV